MATQNDFLPFCPTNTGTNLLTISAYTSSTSRTSGQVPGVASSALNNTALRQANAITSQFAQYVAERTQTYVEDNAVTAQLLAQIYATFVPLAPVITQLTSGSGTFYQTTYFFCATANATAGAVYTNNSANFTVQATISSAFRLVCTGSGTLPTTGGTLTKSSGTGDATITFYAYRVPVYMRVKAVGGGGGGAGSRATTPTDGGAGTNGVSTTFGTSLLTAGGGVGGLFSSTPSAGGSNTITAPAYGISIVGTQGGVSSGNNSSIGFNGGDGGSSPFFGGTGVAGSGSSGGAGYSGTSTTGSGGGGAGSSGGANARGGGGGGSGGYIDAIIPSPGVSYAWVVGTGGTYGSAGSSGEIGAAGAGGQIYLEEHFQ